jgi:RNA polymerase sigma-70 factor, ECF subfamily
MSEDCLVQRLLRGRPRSRLKPGAGSAAAMGEENLWPNTFNLTGGEGDAQGVKELLAVVLPVVAAYCRAQAVRPEDADQLLQDVSRAVVADLMRYDASDAPIWDRVDEITSRKLAEAPSAERTPPASVASPAGREVSKRRGHRLSAEQARLLARLLKVLPVEQRNVLVNRVPLGRTLTETAESVGTSPGAVRLIQHRALARLRRELRSQLHDHD